MNATLLQQQLHSDTGTTVSTVQNSFHVVDLYSRRPMVCVTLAARHRWTRREWTTEHVNWTRNEWRKILFSDEFRFSVHVDNRRIFIQRERDTRNNPAILQENARFGDGGVMVYAGISIDRRTKIHIIRNGILIDRRYRDQILRRIMIPYAVAIGDNFMSMHNCRPNRADLVDEFLFEERIVRIEWLT